MQNCKKIVLIQYQNLHKCSVKRPVSLAWPLHIQSAGTSTGVTAVHTYREIGIQQLKLNSANNIGEKTTWKEDRQLSGLGVISESTQEGNGSKQKAGFCISNSRRSSERGVLPEKDTLDQRPYIEWYQVKITTETNRITAAN